MISLTLRKAVRGNKLQLQIIIIKYLSHFIKRLRNIVAIDLSQDDGEESQAGSSSRYSA